MNNLMKGKMAAGGVPPGAYTTKFTRLEAVPPDPIKNYGGGVRWLFEITAGDHAGQKTSRITSGHEPTPKNAYGKMLNGVLGKTLAPNEPYDLTPLRGKPFVVMVAASEGGGTRVESVAPLNPAPVIPPPAAA